MARIEQADLAASAKVSVDTIKRIERTAGPISANIATVNAIVAVLEAAGVEFTNGGQPGVRMRKADSPRAVIAKGAEARGRAKTAVDEALANVDVGHKEKAARKRKLTSVPKELKEATDTIPTEDLNASNDE